MKEGRFNRVWGFLAAWRIKIFSLQFQLGLKNPFLLSLMKETSELNEVVKC